jgi:phosphocarrier protein HPr
LNLLAISISLPIGVVNVYALTSAPVVDKQFRFNRRDRSLFLFQGKMKTDQSITLRIINALGLHARSAAKLAKLAGEAQGNVWITKSGNTADAGSLLDILTLNCPEGTEITITIDDEADRNILTRIEALIRSGFGE